MARGRTGMTMLFAALTGAALAYYLDPDRGPRRRNVTRDRATSMGQKVGENVGKATQFTAQKATGVVRETVPTQRDNPNPDDRTLRDRVESEVFRLPEVPKGQINLDVIEGVVELRGELATQDDIDRLIALVRQVPDVQDVRSYLHLPDTVAPNKEDVAEIS